jgi:hypothetical protein
MSSWVHEFMGSWVHEFMGSPGGAKEAGDERRETSVPLIILSSSLIIPALVVPKPFTFTGRVYVHVCYVTT